MSLSIKLPACLRSPLAAASSKTLNKLSVCIMAMAACGVSAVHADATLSYELTAADGNKTVKQFSTARFFIRIDDPADTEHYLLFQAGKFFPLFSVNPSKSTYTRLTPAVTPYLSSESRPKSVAEETAVQGGSKQTAEVAHKPAAILKPTKKTRNVEGINCRIVHELLDGKPVIEHCMANSARLGVTDREIITLSRLFKMSRDREFGWLGTGTEDESFVSVQSRDLRDNRVMQLTALSTKPLPAGTLRIPPSYKEVATETKAAPGVSQVK